MKKKAQNGLKLSPQDEAKLLKSKLPKGDIQSLYPAPTGEQQAFKKNADLNALTKGLDKSVLAPAKDRTPLQKQQSANRRKNDWDALGYHTNDQGLSPQPTPATRLGNALQPVGDLAEGLADASLLVAPVDALGQGIYKGLTALGSNVTRGLGNVQRKLIQAQFEATAGPRARQVREGNQWLRDWYSHPESKRRYDDFLAESQPLPDWVDPVSANVLDDVLKAKSNYADLVAGDDIVDPSLTPLMDNALGSYTHQTNTAKVNINHNAFMDPKQSIQGTTIHEGIHKLTVGNQGIGDKPLMNMFQSFRPGATEYEKYLVNPTEAHARIGELRYEFGLKPGEEVTDDIIDNIMQKGLSGQTSVDQKFFQLSRDENKLKRLFNTLPVAAPAVVGAGVAAKQYKNGGSLPMAKSGIHINPENKGKFNATKKATGKSTEELTHSKNPVTRKRAIFAQNAAKWHHAQDGTEYLPTAYASAPRPMTSFQGIQNRQLQPNSYKPYEEPWSMLPIDKSTEIDPNTLPQDAMNNQQNMASAPGAPAPTPPKNRKRTYDGRYGDMALAGLLAVDALIPERKQPSFVTRPLTAYNEHPYGTNSTMLAKDGIKISNSGYKNNSKDKNQPKLRIPSNRITMQDVPHPVYGEDNLGNGQLMYPGEEYQFDGDYVDETPIYAQNGANIPQTRRMQPQEIDYFNNFNKFVDSSGYKGSNKLNNQAFSKQLYEQYKKQTNGQLSYEELIPMAQQEQFLQKDFDVDFAKRKGNPNAQAIQDAAITKYDGMYGPLTSSRNIPIATQVDKVNNRVVRDTTLGYVPNTINPAQQPKYKKPIPKDAQMIETSEGTGYYDPQQGNFVKMNNGGSIKYKQGSVHELDNETIKSLVKAGYKLQYVK